MGMDRSARFDREMQQGIRDEGGALVGGLVMLDFCAGYDDAKARRPFPDEPSLSYELGRTRAQEDMELDRAVLAGIEERQEASHQAVRAMLADKPDVLADYDAQIAAIRGRP